ncbi:MAG: hypothetical protein ABIH42_09720 [Planctomycetota bacterium]
MVKKLVAGLALAGICLIVMADTESYNVVDAIRRNGLQQELKNVQQDLDTLTEQLAILEKEAKEADTSGSATVDVPHRKFASGLQAIEKEIEKRKEALLYIAEKMEQMERLEHRFSGELNARLRERFLQLTSAQREELMQAAADNNVDNLSSDSLNSWVSRQSSFQAVAQQRVFQRRIN